ncbi:hypothetical protein CDL12_12429 [Handroanthus impetiginosus]|uniref:Uncharacterized protein n=1 Tax=Handroanthus impetiginosus TaxID=429701 RepID=A0A2G9HBM4_9LAMI|nr:hypothetical protein CDL12_12429 [Handroanthus impetiginosus]
MKFFSELGSCWGGAMVSPAAEAGVGGQLTEVQGGNYHTRGQRTSRRLEKVRSSGRVNHWKPKLSAISEDSPMSEVVRAGVRRFATSVHGKRPVKVKLKSPAKAVPPPEEDYWKYSYTMALPAFSPTSFLF